MKHLLLLTAFGLMTLPGLAQIGGDNVYEFVNLSNAARVTALGGSVITVADGDLALGWQNPAALNAEMHHGISFNHSFFLAGIQHGYASYGYHHKPWRTTFHGGVQYATYGEFDATDPTGMNTGTFEASEYAIVLGAGHQLYERLSLGANLKVISSQFEAYNSVGLLGDLSALYQDTSSNLTLGLVFRNFGGQLSTYRPDNTEDVPFDVQIGLSKRLRYLPFRFSVIYHNLHRWNILYDDPNSEETVLFINEGEEPPSDNVFLDNLARHFIFSGEFLFGKKEVFRVQFGYNHLLNRELSVDNYRSLAGFSFGFGLKIKRIRVDYGRGVYHLAGGLNHFSISTNLHEFSSKKMLDLQ